MTTIEQVKCQWNNCNKIFKSAQFLQGHFKDHVSAETVEGKDAWKCYWDGCQKHFYYFAEKSRLLTHMRIHCRDLIRCDCGCGIDYQTRNQYEKHREKNQRTYPCRVGECPKSFTSSSGRAKHEKTHTPTHHYCPTCDYYCKSKSGLINHHLRKHQTKLPLKYHTKVIRDRTPIIATPTPPPIQVEEEKPPIWMYYDDTEQVVPECDNHVKDYADEEQNEEEYENYVNDDYNPMFFTEDEIKNCSL